MHHKERKAVGFREILEVAYPQAINQASLEVESGCYKPEELDRKV